MASSLAAGWQLTEWWRFYGGLHTSEMNLPETKDWLHKKLPRNPQHRICVQNGAWNLPP
jgi:hypothetical protein